MAQPNDTTILIVDDDPEVTRSVGAAMAAEGFTVETAPDSLSALEMLADAPYALVIAPAHARGISGTEFANQAAVHGPDTFLLLLTSHSSPPADRAILSSPGCDLLEAPFTQSELRDKAFGLLSRRREALTKSPLETTTVTGLDSLARRFHDLSSSIATSLSMALSLTHLPTHAHCERVALRSAALADAMGASTDDVKSIYLAGLLHDLGKVTVSAAVLDKVGPLDEAEMRQVRSHPEASERIVSSIALPPVTMSAIRHHHEWFDGSGYPSGISGDAIPFGARIVAVCDAYDAMTTTRPYKAAVSREEALRELEAGANSQFDPQIVSVFRSLREAQEV